MRMVDRRIGSRVTVDRADFDVRIVWLLLVDDVLVRERGGGNGWMGD